jgi:hypothetical protein
MPTNVFFNHAVSSEQHLYEDLVVESLRMYGHNVYYLPREIIEEDTILGEDVASKFGDAYEIEAYLENVEGFEGEGDLYSKFGVEIRDQATFVIALRTWERFVSLDNNLTSSFRPNEGDVIYFPLSGSLFEIKFVEHEDPFYQVGKLFVFKCRCELFEYRGEDFDTGTNADLVEAERTYTITTTMTAGSGDSGNYVENEDLKIGDNVVGEVSTYKQSNRTLTITHNNTPLAVGDRLVGATSGATRQIATITDALDMPNDPNAQNKEFEDAADNYIDFSETNPFGEIGNNS